MAIAFSRMQHYITLTAQIQLRNTDQVLFSGLQMTDVELDARVTALEENSGSGTTNGKVLDVIYSLEYHHFFPVNGLVEQHVSQKL